jgi:ribosomal protein S27E
MIRATGKVRGRVFFLAEKPGDIGANIFQDTVDLSTEFGDRVQVDQLSSADVITLFVRDETWGKNTVKKIRSRPELFLKPILVLSESGVDNLNDVVDGEVILPVAANDLNSRIDELLSISEKIRGLPAPTNGSGREKLGEVLILRYLYARAGSSLSPVRSLQSPTGYSYPSVQWLLDVPPGEEIEVMKSMEEALLLKGRLIDKVHLCPFCRHYQINFRETCPACRSLRISEEPTIHHFRCAYVGKEEDFRQGEALRCPKCGKKIRHIGVDYDRPTSNFWCEGCGENFSEPMVNCFCLNCARTFAPDYAFARPINAYTLTEAGGRAAEAGILPDTSLAELLKKEFGFYKLGLFKEFLKMEIVRCNRNNFDSTLGRVAIQNLREITGEEGVVRAGKVKEEIAVLFKEMLRESDILTEIDHDEILVILTNTNEEQARIALDRIRDKVVRQMRNRVVLDYHLKGLQGLQADVEEALATI